MKTTLCFNEVRKKCVFVRTSGLPSKLIHLSVYSFLSLYQTQRTTKITTKNYLAPEGKLELPIN